MASSKASKFASKVYTSYDDRVRSINNNKRVKHLRDKRVGAVHTVMHQREDSNQLCEHEENMLQKKLKKKEKERKAKEFMLEQESQWAEDDGSGSAALDEVPAEAVTGAASGTEADAGRHTDEGEHDDEREDEDDAPAPLRFAVGDRVRCRISRFEWAPGRVASLRFREPSWPVGVAVPYLVQLEVGDLIFAPEDNAKVIQHDEGGTSASALLAQAGGGGGEVATYYY